jgi:hypothetical protein
MVAVLKNAWFGFARAVKRHVDRVHHSINIMCDLIVPKAKDTIAFGLKPFRTQLVSQTSFIFAMLRTVDLNNEARRRTGKIDNELSDWHLPSKVSAAGLEALQIAPEPNFWVGRTFP